MLCSGGAVVRVMGMMAVFEVGMLVMEALVKYNQLTSISPEVGRLVALRALHLSENLLTSVPPETAKDFGR